MNFKSALEFLPKSYDGQNIPVSKFVRDCLFARDSIQPKERPLLLRMIRSRLCGDKKFWWSQNPKNRFSEGGSYEGGLKSFRPQHEDGSTRQ